MEKETTIKVIGIGGGGGNANSDQRQAIGSDFGLTTWPASHPGGPASFCSSNLQFAK